MFAYQDASMFSGRKGAALAAVGLLHVLLAYAFYAGLAQPIIEHLVPPIVVDTVQRPHEKVVVQTSAPQFEPMKLRYDEPEIVTVAADPSSQITVEPKRDDPPATVERAPVREPVAATSARMDPKHPLHVGADYYPPSAIRSGQEGRCIVQVIVAADGRISDSSLQASSGSALLDDACLSAVRGQRMLPATRDGRAVDSSISLPIVWRLTGSR